MPQRSIAVCAVAAAALNGAAFADTNIDPGGTYLASNVGKSVYAVFAGGTLKFDSATTISKDFDVRDVATNTIDTYGHDSTLSGALTGAGPLTILDSVGSGSITFTNSGNTYTGITTIASSGKLLLTGTGTIADSSVLVDNGIFDISGTDTGAAVVSLRGTGSVILGSETFTISDAAGDTFGGVISGKGAVILTEGTQTLTGTNTYTGITTISSGTLYLSGTGSIASSSAVAVGGTLDISGTSAGASIKSLYGAGTVVLGSQTLTLSNASSSFSGVISGSGGVTLTNGTEYLSGPNTFTGVATVNGGLLEVGAATINYNVVNNATFGFYSTTAITMNGVISGTGTVSNLGSGVTTITSAQAYTGPTSITAGTLALTGAGSIANSSNVSIFGIFDVSDSGATVQSLSGTGTIKLGTQTLTINNGSDSFTGSLTGTGNVVIAGGAQVFGGSSTYNGLTTISGGKLVLSAGASLKSTVVDNTVLDLSSGTVATGSASIGSLTGSGAVTLGANTLVLSGANDTFYGTISGTGGLWLSGGTETLAGANTYTGTTTISGGTLILAATGSLDPTSKVAASGTFDVSNASGSAITFASLAGSGTVKLGAKTLNLTAASGSFSGVLQGSGGLAIAGGTQILTGTNTYTGGTTIASSGALQIGNDTASGSVVGDIVDNGKLVFARSDSSSFAGTISGSGSVTVYGSGTTVFSANNTYSGSTTITYATLQLGNGGTTGAIAGDVVDNGTLAFARSDAVTFGGVISGSGKVNVLSGTTTLSAVETYTGLTTVKSGATLVLTGSIAASSGVVANGTFDVSGASAPKIAALSGSGSVLLGGQTLTLTNANGTFSGVVAGNGGLTLSAGAETLSGTNTYTGATTINGGALAVSGSIAASSGVVVNSGGTLSGTGTVSALTVNSGGKLEPGSAGSGTLTVNGNVRLASGSNYVVDVSSASSTKLSATGSATLAGTLTVEGTNATYPLGQKLTVLTASGGINGTFALADVVSSGAEFKSVLSYDANNVYLKIDLSKLSPLLPSGAAGNQTHVVAGIDAAIAAGNSLPSAFENLANDTADGLLADATQLAGEIGADVPQVGRALAAPFLDAMFDHAATRTPKTDLWLDGMASTAIVAGSATSGADRLKTSVSGLVAGAACNVSPGFTLGGALSGETSHFRLAAGNGKGDAKAFQAGVYGHLQIGPHIYNSFALAAGLANITTTRTLSVSGSDVLEGKASVKTLGGRYEAGVDLNWLAPYVALQDVTTMVPAYSEKATSGADTFALSYASRNVNTASAELGFRQETDVAFKPHWLLTPDGTIHLTDKLAWAHEFGNSADAKATFLALPSSVFTVTGAEPGSDYALASLGADLRFNNGLRITSHLDTAFSKRSQSFSGFAGIGYTW